MLEPVNPAPRLLMGPGPINADPRVLRAISAPLLGQFDPEFRRYMREVSELYRGVFQTKNRWTLLIDGTARAGIEAALVSLIEPGDRVLVPVFGRFGHLIAEIARRAGGEVSTLEAEWGSVFPDEVLEREVKKRRPKIVAVCHGDTSTTMAQPLARLGEVCRTEDALESAFARHAVASKALRAGLAALGLELFGDRAHRMPNVSAVHIPAGVDGEKVRRALLEDSGIEIGTSFGPLHGKIWRIGTMGYNAREDAVLATLAGMEAILGNGKRGAAVDAANAVYRGG